jgi:hypothetical protein
MPLKGAGGSNGGIGRFFMGLVMLIAGGYLLLDSIRIAHHFHFGYAISSFGGLRLTSGMTLVPLIFGIGFIFYNARNPLGWALTLAALIMLGFGIITSLRFRMRTMSAFELIMILTLFVGGAGLFLSSLRNYEEKKR